MNPFGNTKILKPLAMTQTLGKGLSNINDNIQNSPQVTLKIQNLPV